MEGILPVWRDLGRRRWEALTVRVMALALVDQGELSAAEARLAWLQTPLPVAAAERAGTDHAHANGEPLRDESAHVDLAVVVGPEHFLGRGELIDEP